jgi:N-methylhydantoinase B/oxoprolinase/acetone carboxylase alpha subunit
LGSQTGVEFAGGGGVVVAQLVQVPPHVVALSLMQVAGPPGAAGGPHGMVGAAQVMAQQLGFPSASAHFVWFAGQA